MDGEEFSLDDIKHPTLHPIWRDPRIHYAVHYASVGFPRLRPYAYTASNTEQLLETAARDYINHPRGARVDREGVTLSGIYDGLRRTLNRTVVP